MKRTYSGLHGSGVRAVKREAEREGLEVRWSRGRMIIEGDEKSVKKVSRRLSHKYNNGDGRGILSREEHPGAFW